jgi:DNA topoisomerase-1
MSGFALRQMDTATGRDTRGRKQYRYHDRWREMRDENKFGRLADFAKVFAEDLAARRSRHQVGRSATGKGARHGCSNHDKKSTCDGEGTALAFSFPRKEWTAARSRYDRSANRENCLKVSRFAGPGFVQYVTDEGEVRSITSQDVNDYLREITSGNFTAKDFRTWAGTVLAAIALNAQAGFETKKQAKANVKTPICAAAKLLGNTPAICRKCYVHPPIIEAYLNRMQIPGLAEAVQAPEKVNLRAVETAVLKFLRTA